MWNWIKTHKLATAGIVIGGIFVVRAARGSVSQSSSSEQASYTGPSVIGAPGPVVTMPTNTDQSATPTPTPAPATDPLQLAAFISGEVEKARQTASVANTASATTTNVDLISSVLEKIKPNKLAGNKLSLSYNDTGQMTSLEMNKVLAPLSLSQAAKEQAKATGISQKSILAGYKSGFVDATGAKLTNAQMTKLTVADYLAAVAAGKKTGGAVGIVPTGTESAGGLKTIMPVPGAQTLQ